MSAPSYLAAHGVESAIARAIASVVSSRPEDPIAAVAHLLLEERPAAPAFVAYCGCYTLPGCADPWEKLQGGVPHDRSIVGDGIRRLLITATGAITVGEVVAQLPNPSYICLAGGERPTTMYAVSEVDDESITATACAFKLPTTAGTAASPLGRSLPTKGGWPCHVASTVTPTGESLVLVSNYGGGSLALFSVAPDGGLGELVQLVEHTGSSTDKVRQVRQWRAFSSHATLCLHPGCGSSHCRRRARTSTRLRSATATSTWRILGRMLSIRTR